jgi:hypothetical protein
MAFRCQKCGRILKNFKGGPMFCNGKDGCKNKPLPRCTNCNSLYREEKTGKHLTCPSSKAPGGQHVYPEVA